VTDFRIGIVVNGATSGLARHQHLRALLEIKSEGGLPLRNGDRLFPDPILVGRNRTSLRALADETGIERWTTDLEAALKAADDTIFFDVAIPGARFDNVCKAIAAGKHMARSTAPWRSRSTPTRRALKCPSSAAASSAT
jgi:predicted dehydrogenase